MLSCSPFSMQIPARRSIYREHYCILLLGWEGINFTVLQLEFFFQLYLMVPWSQLWKVFCCFLLEYIKEFSKLRSSLLFFRRWVKGTQRDGSWGGCNWTATFSSAFSLECACVGEEAFFSSLLDFSILIGVSNSFLLLKVNALQCSLLSFFEFISELLGEFPYYLLENILAI